MDDMHSSMPNILKSLAPGGKLYTLRAHEIVYKSGDTFNLGDSQYKITIDQPSQEYNLPDQFEKELFYMANNKY